jgi:hypothetical protein
MFLFSCKILIGPFIISLRAKFSYKFVPLSFLKNISGIVIHGTYIRAKFQKTCSILCCKKKILTICRTKIYIFVRKLSFL